MSPMAWSHLIAQASFKLYSKQNWKITKYYSQVYICKYMTVKFSASTVTWTSSSDIPWLIHSWFAF